MTSVTERFDLLQAVIGLFTVVGVALTAVAAYALFDTFGVTLSTDLAVSVLSGVSLVAFLVVLSSWFYRDVGRRRV